MLWFIVCVAVLNMAAGFAIAVYLAGHGVDAAASPSDDSSGRVAERSTHREMSGQTPAGIAEVATPSGAPEHGETAAENENEPDPRQNWEEGADSGDSSILADLDAAVSLALGDAALPENPEVLPARTQEEPDRDQGEAALRRFQSQLDGFCAELVDLDDRLRARTSETAAELKSHVDSVTDSTGRQDEACQEAEQSLRQMMAAEAMDEKRGEAMIAAIHEERKAASETVVALDKIDFENDPAAQQAYVLERTEKLLQTNHGLRDTVSDVISAAQSPDVEEETYAAVDPLTELMSRAALDAALAEHWKKDPHHVRAVSLTIVDLDQFAKFNRAHGPGVGNRVLRAIAKLMAGELPADSYAARFAGQRFALLSIDRDLKQAVGDAERLRQTVETARLEYGQRDLEIKVSCGVVAATADDTRETLYARAVESVQEAKRYGRNRTFVHEGEFPTPVVPPNFAINEKHVTI